MTRNFLRAGLGWGGRDWFRCSEEIDREWKMLVKNGDVWASSTFSTQGWGSSCFHTLAVWWHRWARSLSHLLRERGHWVQTRGHSVLRERKFLTRRALWWIPVVTETGQVPFTLALKTKDSSSSLCGREKMEQMNCCCHWSLVTLHHSLNIKSVKLCWEMLAQWPVLGHGHGLWPGSVNSVSAPGAKV